MNSLKNEFVEKFANTLKELGVHITEMKAPAQLGEKLINVGEEWRQFYCGCDFDPVKLALSVSKIGETIQFVPLVLPRTAEISQMHYRGDVAVRYVEWFNAVNDEIEGRYDVLVRAV